MTPGRRWWWKAAAYTVLAALANAATSPAIIDGSALSEIACFAVLAALGEWFMDRRGRRMREARGLAADGGCAGPHSVTTWDCNGELAEWETCSPVGTPLDEHNATHAEGVIEHANELGCP